MSRVKESPIGRSRLVASCLPLPSPNAGSNNIATTYARAPQASVTVSPNWIAIMIASTDPSTLEAAFIAHAHSTAPCFAVEVAEEIAKAVSTILLDVIEA